MSKAFFKITAGKSKGATLPISPNKPTLIGRNKGDFILKDPLVSGSHARVTYEDNGWYIQDLESTNGTQVDGRSVSKAKLRPGAVITIGNHTLVLFVEIPKKDSKAATSTSSRQEIAWLLDEERHQINSSQTRGQVLPNNLQFPPNIEATLKVVLGEDASKEFKITSGTIIIGRNAGDIPIDDQEVSRQHAQINFFGKKMIYLQDLGSTNGTFHNNRKTIFTQIQDGSSIGIGRSTLILQLKEL
jgi:pSer/pThr/pTyr-binding forkhead associated (FHA) protein